MLRDDSKATVLDAKRVGQDHGGLFFHVDLSRLNAYNLLNFNILPLNGLNGFKRQSSI